MAYWKGTATAAAVDTDWTTWEIEGIPESCLLAELVILLTAVSGASRATVFISHDDDGKVGVVPFVTSSATQTINDAQGGGSGFVAFSLGAVWISDKGENPRIHCKLDTGTATATPRLYAHREGQR